MTVQYTGHVYDTALPLAEIPGDVIWTIQTIWNYIINYTY